MVTSICLRFRVWSIILYNHQNYLFPNSAILRNFIAQRAQTAQRDVLALSKFPVVGMLYRSSAFLGRFLRAVPSQQLVSGVDLQANRINVLAGAHCVRTCRIRELSAIVSRSAAVEWSQTRMVDHRELVFASLSPLLYSPVVCMHVPCPS